MLIEVKNKEEAYYLVGILNSYLVRAFVRTYSIETQITPELISRIRIPPFSPRDPDHKKIIELARKMINQPETETEDKLSAVVGSLFGVSKDDVDRVKEYLELSDEGSWRRPSKMHGRREGDNVPGF